MNERILWHRPPCRFEEYLVTTNTTTADNSSVNTMLIFDIAHNVDAMKALVNRMVNKYPNKTIR